MQLIVYEILINVITTQANVLRCKNHVLEIQDAIVSCVIVRKA